MKVRAKNGYVIVTPDNSMLVFTCRMIKHQTVKTIESIHDESWESLEEQGYKVIPVSLTPIIEQ